MIRTLYRFVLTGLFLLCSVSANGRVGQCVDIENVSDSSSDQNRWVLTNTCQHAVDVSIERNGGNRGVCVVLHIEPGASRSFKQQKICRGGINSLIVGCSCENGFNTVERDSS